MKAPITSCVSVCPQDHGVEPQAEVLPHCLSILMSSAESVKPRSHQDHGTASPTFPLCLGLLLYEVWLQFSPLLQTINNYIKVEFLATSKN